MKFIGEIVSLGRKWFKSVGLCHADKELLLIFPCSDTLCCGHRGGQ